MGAGVALLFLGVLALILFMPKQRPAAPPDPERALLLIHDGTRQQVLAVVLVESRSRGSLSAVAMPGRFRLEGTTVDAAAELGAGGSAAVQRTLAQAAGRQIHHRLAVSFDLIVRLIDAAGGIDLDGSRMSGGQAIAWWMAPPEETERAGRAADALLALLDAAGSRGVAIGFREGLALARQVESSIDLMSMPDVLQRWTAYGRPRIATVPVTGGEVDAGALRELLLPDPPAQ